MCCGVAYPIMYIKEAEALFAGQSNDYVGSRDLADCNIFILWRGDKIKHVYGLENSEKKSNFAS